MADLVIPEIPDDMKTALKNERLAQYKARIFQTQMDIAAYSAAENDSRLTQANNNLNELLAAYYAVEAMV